MSYAQLTKKLRGCYQGQVTGDVRLLPKWNMFMSQEWFDNKTAVTCPVTAVSLQSALNFFKQNRIVTLPRLFKLRQVLQRCFCDVV